MKKQEISKQYPNFKELTEYLNKKKNPRRILYTIVSLCKPSVNSINDNLQKSNIVLGEIFVGRD